MKITAQHEKTAQHENNNTTQNFQHNTKLTAQHKINSTTQTLLPEVPTVGAFYLTVSLYFLVETVSL